VTNTTGDDASAASWTSMTTHQYMYPKVTPVLPRPTAGKPGGPTVTRPC
jgi:hypothetical protein